MNRFLSFLFLLWNCQNREKRQNGQSGHSGQIYCLEKKEELTLGDLKILSGNMNETITLKCENSKNIHILDASYGKPTVDHFLIKKNIADVPHTLPVVQMLCEGKNSCEIVINNQTFKILTLITDFKKFIVKYSCLSEKLKSAPQYTVTSKRGSDRTWSIEFSPESEGTTELYLHVNNINASCEEPIIKKNYSDVNEAVQECNNLESCVFIILNKEGYILCKSSNYKNAVIENGSRIYIKISHIAGNVPSNFEVLPNIQGVCEKEEIVHELENVLKLDDVYQSCEQVGCDYFTMSTANGVKGASKTFRNHVWFCKGFPKYVAHDGFIFVKNNKGSTDPKQRMKFKGFEGPLT